MTCVRFCVYSGKPSSCITGSLWKHRARQRTSTWNNLCLPLLAQPCTEHCIITWCCMRDWRIENNNGNKNLFRQMFKAKKKKKKRLETINTSERRSGDGSVVGPSCRRRRRWAKRVTWLKQYATWSLQRRGKVTVWLWKAQTPYHRSLG